MSFPLRPAGGPGLQVDGDRRSGIVEIDREGPEEIVIFLNTTSPNT